MNAGGMDTEPTSRHRWPWHAKPKHLDRQDETREPARSPKSLLIDLAVLFGLGGMAVTQPLLELLGANPTFFVAGNYSAGQIVWFAAIVAVVPAVIVFALTAPFSLIGERCAAASHGAAVFVLAALFGLALTRTLGLDALLVAGALAVALGLTVAVAQWRLSWARRFLTYLAIGNVIFLLMFLLASPSARLLGGASYADDDKVMVPPLEGPVILVVLDEFPLTSLIDSQGQIIEERYPNIADLARQSSWFRNAAAETTATFVSVPSILSGVRGDSDNLPSYRDYPNNYFTMFGSKYPINRYEPVTDVCPPDHCKPPPSSPLSQAIADSLVVYGHRVLPESLRTGLPDIDRGWGNFGDDLNDEAASPPDDPFVNAEGEIADEPMTKLADLAESDKGRVGQSRAFLRQIQQIGSEPSVDFMHFLLPHHPYLLTPWDTINADHWIPSDTPAQPGKPGYDWAYRELYALQALQLGAVDAMIGDLMDRLEATGAWEDALLVVTSDHGIDISPPGVGRTPNDDNMDELFRVPMFIKAPGQTEGEIRDEPASTVDVLPSIADLLGVETSWSFEGHSLFDGSEPETERLLDTEVEAAFETAESHTSQFRGHGWEDLAAVGAGADLVGQPVSAFETGDPSELQVAFDHAELLDDLSASSGEVPYWLRGAASGSDDAPPELAIAVNGTFAGTVGGYRADGDVWRFSGFMANYFTDGANNVAAYEVEEGAAGVVLHPAATS